MVVDPVPAAHCHIRLTVAPVKPPTQLKKIASKMKAVPHPTTRLCVRKVTQITSPMPKVAGVEAPSPPIAGLSWESCDPLFEEPVGLGHDHVRMGAPTSSGK